MWEMEVRQGPLQNQTVPVGVVLRPGVAVISHHLFFNLILKRE